MFTKFVESFKNKFKHQLFRNAVSGSSGFVFISLIGLLITPFLVANFGIEQYGIYILVSSVVGYYGIFDFGLGQGLVKFVAEFNAQKMTVKLNDSVNSVLFVQLLIGAVLTVIIFFFSQNIIDLLRVSATYYNDSVIALKVASLGFLFSMLAGTYSSSIKGLEYYGTVTIIDSVSNLLLYLFLLLILLMNYGIKEAVWSNVGIAFCQLIFYVIFFKRFNNSYRFAFRFDLKIIKIFLSFSIYLFLSKISNIFAIYVVRFVIAFFLGPIAVTYYVVPSKLLGAFGGVLSSAANAIFPYTSRLAALGKNEEIKSSFIKSNLIFAAVSLPISMFIILFSKPIMTLWMGEEFAEKSWIVLSIICFSGTIGSFSAIPNLVLLGLGNSKLIGIFSGITIVSYAFFLPLFTKNFGIIGAANALLITSVIVIGFVLVKTTKAIGLELFEFLKKVYGIHFIPMIAITLSVISYKIFFQEVYLIELAFGAGLVLFYYMYLFKKKALIF